MHSNIHDALAKAWQSSGVQATENHRFRLGTDENGLGPRLGPMLVTGVLCRTTAEGDKTVIQKPSEEIAKRLGDSKSLVSHGNIALAEAWARALIEREIGKTRPIHTPSDIFEVVSLDNISKLQSMCPSHSLDQCWHTKQERFIADNDLVQAVRNDIEFLAKQGIEILAARSIVLCTNAINQAHAQGISRFALDLHAMERLILYFRSQTQESIYATCGKVGGIGYYSKAFGPLKNYPHTIVHEDRKQSTYWFPDVGEISFVQDCDATNLIVSIASLVGKYLRELLMQRIVAYYQAIDSSLSNVSGYHDPVTARFVESTALIRRNRHIDDACFSRDKRSSKSNLQCELPFSQ